MVVPLTEAQDPAIPPAPVGTSGRGFLTEGTTTPAPFATAAPTQGFGSSFTQVKGNIGDELFKLRDPIVEEAAVVAEPVAEPIAATPIDNKSDRSSARAEVSRLRETGGSPRAIRDAQQKLRDLRATAGVGKPSAPSPPPGGGKGGVAPPPAVPPSGNRSTRVTNRKAKQVTNKKKVDAMAKRIADLEASGKDPEKLKKLKAILRARRKTLKGSKGRTAKAEERLDAP